MAKLSKITFVSLVTFTSLALIAISLKTIGLENSVPLFQVVSCSTAAVKNGLDIADQLQKKQVDTDDKAK